MLLVGEPGRTTRSLCCPRGTESTRSRHRRSSGSRNDKVRRSLDVSQEVGRKSRNEFRVEETFQKGPVSFHVGGIVEMTEQEEVS